MLLGMIVACFCPFGTVPAGSVSSGPVFLSDIEIRYHFSDNELFCEGSCKGKSSVLSSRLEMSLQYYREGLGWVTVDTVSQWNATGDDPMTSLSSQIEKGLAYRIRLTAESHFHAFLLESRTMDSLFIKL